MKPIFAKIQEDVQMDVFALRVIDLPYFSTEFHFHKECQMVYVVESEGKRIIGDNIETFSSDELILLGPNIPHVWHNDKRHFEKKAHARSVALFFDPDKLREAMTLFGMVKPLESILRKSQRGMKFTGRAKYSLQQMLLSMIPQRGLARLITFIRMLELLARIKEYELLASPEYENTYQTKDNDRINRVFKYVFSHFKTDIQLDDIARLANMNKQAFCRYFKGRTQKTFVQFVNEVRIGHACKLMAEGETQISGLAYECGFNTLSNFNRIFKEMKGMPPRDYLKMLRDI